MELRKDLELVMVEFENGGKKAIMTFLDRERQQAREVSWNKQIYKDGKFIDDAEKAAKVDSWAEEYFGTTFDNLESCIGVCKDVYIYDRFCSLYEVSEVHKFELSQEGEIYQTTVEEIIVDDVAIRIRYKIDGDLYETKHVFAKYIETMQEWVENPQKKERVYKKFEERYGVPVSEKDSLIGHPLMVEVKKAFGSVAYGEIKKFPKKG